MAKKTPKQLAEQAEYWMYEATALKKQRDAMTTQCADLKTELKAAAVLTGSLNDQLTDSREGARCEKAGRLGAGALNISLDKQNTEQAKRINELEFLTGSLTEELAEARASVESLRGVQSRDAVTVHALTEELAGAKKTIIDLRRGRLADIPRP